MKVVRLKWQEKARWGVKHGNMITLWTDAPYGNGEPTEESVPWDGVELLAPCEPSKVVCVGRNYAAHAAELGNDVPKIPLLFLKPPSSLMGPDENVVLPAISERVDFEGELALVIGKKAKGIAPEDVWEYVYGVTCFDDVTARDLQKADKTFTRGKGFDTFGPCGPWLETEFSPGEMHVETRVNGVVRQSASVQQMIFPLDVVVAYISSIMTLEVGDLIVTGTPEGVGPLYPGDAVEIEVTGVGILKHGVQGSITGKEIL